MTQFVLAIDQGTTSSRAIVFDGDRKVVGVGQQEFAQIFPQDGWVEHDPEEIWESVTSTIKTALDEAKVGASDIAAIGITNQRETVVVWDRETGDPVYNAIVWQDTRTSGICARLSEAHPDGDDRFRAATGLPLSTYFAGPKIRWILEHLDERGERGIGVRP